MDPMDEDPPEEEARTLVATAPASKRGKKADSKHSREHLQRGIWFKICDDFTKYNEKAAKRISQIDFLKSQELSGDHVTGTLSEQQSFSYWLKKYRKGELTANDSNKRLMSEVERKLIAYVELQQKYQPDKYWLDVNTLRDKALKYAELEGLVDFQASNGWIRNCMRRHGKKSVPLYQHFRPMGQFFATKPQKAAVQGLKDRIAKDAKDGHKISYKTAVHTLDATTLENIGSKAIVLSKPDMKGDKLDLIDIVGNKDYLFCNGDPKFASRKPEEVYCTIAAIYQPEESVDQSMQNNSLWVRPEEYSWLKELKKNIIGEANKHFGSLGEYFGFGLVGHFKIDENGASLGAYATKSPDLESKEKFTLLSDKLSKLLQESSNAINSLFGKGSGDPIYCGNSLCLAMRYAFRKTKMEKVAQEDLDETPFPSRFYNVNAQTQVYHTESDGGYTLIGGQVGDSGMVRDPHHLCFCFEITQGKEIKAPMLHNTAVWFHGMFITHRQHHDTDLMKCKECLCCANVSGYINKKLMSHMGCSLTRAATVTKRALEGVSKKQSKKASSLVAKASHKRGSSWVVVAGAAATAEGVRKSQRGRKPKTMMDM
ncbi:MAG: hypothetical protein SGARI_000377 [Bacillariaceae sp.]